MAKFDKLVIMIMENKLTDDSFTYQVTCRDLETKEFVLVVDAISEKDADAFAEGLYTLLEAHTLSTPLV